MPLTYTIVDLPPVWPGRPTRHPRKAPFKSQWARTLHNLERELGHLGAKKVEVALELKRGAMDLRQDGMLKADARPGHAVILSFLDADGQRQAYPCDTFGWWQDNLHAIAVVLEDLRRAERYGVQSSLIRAGFKALPAAGGSTPTMDVQTAAVVLSNYATGIYPEHVRLSRNAAKEALRAARAKCHPDVAQDGGAAWENVETARRVLEAHHGGSL